VSRGPLRGDVRRLEESTEASYRCEKPPPSTEPSATPVPPSPVIPVTVPDSWAQSHAYWHAELAAQSERFAKFRATIR
jgi:hypothetical protein